MDYIKFHEPEVFKQFSTEELKEVIRNCNYDEEKSIDYLYEILGMIFTDC